MGAKAVVYVLTNRLNDKRYVGVTRFASGQRWKRHIKNAARGVRTYLYAAIRKYGASNFDLCDVASCLDLEHATEVERAVIQSLRPEYNQTNGGEFTVGKRVPREVVEKIRAANIGKKRTAAQNAANSARQTALYRQRIDLKTRAIEVLARGRATRWRGHVPAPKTPLKGRTPSPSTREKMAAAKRKVVECATLNAVFDSAEDAAEFCGLKAASVQAVCSGRRNELYGLRFRYIGALNH